MIGVGDLVWIAKWPHKHGNGLGCIRMVASIERGYGECPECKEPIPGPMAVFPEQPTKGVPVAWLRKMPPLEELEASKKGALSRT